MKLQWQPDPDGKAARAYTRTQRENGIRPFSSAHDLLFSTVCKTVVTRTVSGFVSDYKQDGLFDVQWADGSMEQLNRRELNHFLREQERHVRFIHHTR